MADKGPLLTSCIIFYLSIGAAVFQILEEPNWMSVRDKYIQQKENILKNYQCLTLEDLDEILEVASEAAGQGVAITGDNHRNTWDWVNSVIFAATIVTTIGYGNVAPKTKGGRVFCILYGLCGIPLCLVWLSELGSFFGDRAKRLSQVMIRKGISVKKVQFTCTALFLLWGLLVHLVIPPFVFMSVEGWTYLEGIYFSFITLTTVGFGDYVAGVNPDIQYPRLYRVCAEIWIYMGLAWLSLFFSWNVHMVVEAQKLLKKRRHRRRHMIEPEPLVEKQNLDIKPSVIDIFNFLSEKEEDYSTVIKQIGITARIKKAPENINRSKSCSDILAIQTLEHSPRRKRMISISEAFLNAKIDEIEQEEALLQQDNLQELDSSDVEKIKGDGVFGAESDVLEFSASVNAGEKEEENVQHPDGGATRFTICKVAEEEFPLNCDDKG